MKLILVEWVDSAFRSGWRAKAEMLECPMANITSVGIVVYDDKDKVIIIQDADSERNVAEGIVIPKCSIKRLRYLQIKPRPQS